VCEYVVYLLHAVYIISFQRHPEGVVSVAFKEFEAADACIQVCVSVVCVFVCLYCGAKILAKQGDIMLLQPL